MSKNQRHSGKSGHDDHDGHDSGHYQKVHVLIGTRDDDPLTGTDGKDIIRGKKGDDHIDGGAGNDLLFGDKGNDQLFGGDGRDLLFGGKGNDLLDGGAGNDFLFGDKGNDQLFGGTGNDKLLGGKGYDFLDGGAGSDYLFGDKGNDTFNFTASENIGAKDYYDGGKGFDTLRLTLTTAEAELAKDEINAFRAFLEDGCGTFRFDSFGLSVRNFEKLEVVTVGGENTAPVAVGDNYGAVEDQALVILVPGVLANDSDAESSPLTLTAMLVTGPTSGTLTLNDNGSFTYTPMADFFGEDSFTYKAFDGALNSNEATVTLQVAPVNDAPVAVDDTATVTEDSSGNVIVVLGNDSRGPANESGQSLIVSAPSASHGAVVVNQDGTLSYTPDADYFGADTINYTVTDNGTTNGVADPLAASAQVAVTVTEVNDAPIAVDDIATVTEDSSGNVIDVLGNDTNKGAPNESGQTLAVSAASASHGAVVINSDGTLSYTPNADYFGADTINYTVTDNGTTNGLADPLTDSAEVAITVTEVVDTPAAILVAVVGGSQILVENNNAASQLSNSALFNIVATPILVTAHATLDQWKAEFANYDVVVVGENGGTSDYDGTQIFAALRDFVDLGGGIVTTGIFAGKIESYTDATTKADADYISPAALNLAGAGSQFAASGSTITFIRPHADITGSIDSYAAQGLHEVAAAVDDVNKVLAEDGSGRAAIAYDDAVGPGLGRTVFLGSIHMAAQSFPPFDSAATRTGPVDTIFEHAVAWAAGSGSATLLGASATTEELTFDFGAQNPTEGGTDAGGTVLASLETDYQPDLPPSYVSSDADALI